MQAIRLGIVGVGKIARDQHLPSIAANPDFALVAAASPHVDLEGVPCFSSIEAMLEGQPDLDAVSICTPPQARYEVARLALAKGKHVLMEKPPCASLMGLEALERLAYARDRTLYQSWHSRHACAVARAARLLQERRLQRAEITWKEDARRWHPGQSWLWEPGGFGVLDSGINALSILTQVIPEPLFAKAARLFVPANRGTPVAADLKLTTESGIPITAVLDHRHEGPEIWEIAFHTDSGLFRLCKGGHVLALGEPPAEVPADIHAIEYREIYRRFAELIGRGGSDVDARPLSLLADILLVARSISVEPFES